MKVIISAHCRNPDLFGATTLVFDTLRVGFPTAEIVVIDNANSELHRSEIRERCEKVGAEFRHLPEPIDHAVLFEAMIQGAIKEGAAPFYFCDTDIIFRKSVEEWEFKTALAGRWVPEFLDPFTKCVTRPRLHTSLLYVDPVQLGACIETYLEQFPVSPYNPCNLFKPFFHPSHELGAPSLFYDVGSLLSYVATWTAFSPRQLDAYDHLNCGTYADLVDPHLEPVTGRRLTETHAAVIKDQELARGCWRAQDEFYQRNACGH